MPFSLTIIIDYSVFMVNFRNGKYASDIPPIHHPTPMANTRELRPLSAFLPGLIKQCKNAGSFSPLHIPP